MRWRKRANGGRGGAEAWATRAREKEARKQGRGARMTPMARGAWQKDQVEAAVGVAGSVGGEKSEAVRVAAAKFRVGFGG